MRVKDFFRDGNLNKIYLSEAFRKFGFSVITVFIPIYLLNVGYSLKEVALFYVFYSFFHALFTLPAAKLGARVGNKWVILLSVPFYLLFFGLLFSLESHRIPLVYLSITKGFAAGFFWMGRHVFMANLTHKNNRGSELVKNKILNVIISFPGPLIGGFLLTFVGMHFVLGIVFVFLSLSVIPIFFLKEKRESVDLRFRHLFDGFNWREKVILFNRGVDDGVNCVIWPIFIFFSVLNTYVLFGAVKFIEKIFVIISDYFSGKLFDKKGIWTLRLGGFLSIFVWLGRWFVSIPFYVFVVDSFKGGVEPLISTSVDAQCFELARESYHVAHFIAARELLIHFGKMFLFSVVYFVANLKLLFILGFVYSLIYLLIKFDSSPSKRAVGKLDSCSE